MELRGPSDAGLLGLDPLESKRLGAAEVERGQGGQERQRRRGNSAAARLTRGGTPGQFRRCTGRGRGRRAWRGYWACGGTIAVVCRHRGAAVWRGRGGAELLRRRNDGEAAARVTRRCVMDEGQRGPIKGRAPGIAGYSWGRRSPATAPIHPSVTPYQ